MSYNAVADRITARRRSINRAKKFIPILGFIIAALIVTAVIGIGFAFSNQTGTAAACEVTGKDRTTNSDGASVARVYTENCGTFEVKDSILDGRFNSADAYGQLDEGTTYDFTTRGIRLPFFSAFPNIITATETQPATIRFEQ
jgi:hypothetical protein